jgi:hypothetical protein
MLSTKGVALVRTEFVDIFFSSSNAVLADLPPGYIALCGVVSIMLGDELGVLKSKPVSGSRRKRVHGLGIQICPTERDLRCKKQNSVIEQLGI